MPPAVQCVMILSCQFLCVFGGIQSAKTVEKLLNFKLKAFNDGTDAAAMPMGSAPMLGILFINARMRARNMDTVDGAPQK